MSNQNGQTETSRPAEDIAIIGMDCVFPGAPDLAAFWRNIVGKVDAVGDPPADWGADLYFDPESEANDRIYTKKGGFLGSLTQFDPLRHGVMPNSIDGGEPDQFLALEVADRALTDADYFSRPVPGDRVEIVLGRGTYINRGFTTVVQHGVVVDRVLEILRTLHPEHTDDELGRIKQDLKASLPPFNPEMAPALVPNLVTGRIANRLDFQGVNYIVDAACASSHISVQRGVDDLRSGRCDVAIVGGVHASTPPPIFMIFCQLSALSPRGQIRPFDKDADGTLLGEGVGILVLKRLSDAEQAGDRIYALIKAVGSASDGRAVGLLAPRPEGEVLAVRRAYEQVGIDPRTVELIEAHGTGTTVGDAAEVAALKTVFGGRNGPEPTCALGTVKSMISHCLPAAGSAGIIKAALSLHHKILPPTLHCENPNPELGLDTSPFYLNTETRPWIHGGTAPRRAGVNAFGFGGINAHAILEEYRGPQADTAASLLCRPSEVLIVEAGSRAALVARAREAAESLNRRADEPLAEHARVLNGALTGETWRLAVIAGGHGEGAERLTEAAERIADEGCRRIRDRRGIYFTAEPMGPESGVAFLFPGEGSQYENMLRDLCLHFPEVRRWFDLIDRAFVDHPRGLMPSQAIFPPPRPGAATDEDARDGTLWRMDIGPEAIFAANQAVFSLLGRLGLRPAAMLGHSTGEYSALFAAGANRYDDEAKLLDDIVALNRHYESLSEAGVIAKGHLIASAGVDASALDALLAERDDLHLAMDNCPQQKVVCALSPESADWIEDRLGAMGALSARLPFDRAYHTPAFQPFCDRLDTFFDRLTIRTPQTRLYSCMTAAPMPDAPEEIRRLATHQWAGRVRFRETIERMYEDGTAIFVECGPRNNLTAFVNDILKGRPHLALPTDVQFQEGVTQLNHLIAQLAAHGVKMDLAALYDGAAGRAANAGATHGRPPMQLKTGLQPLRLSPDFAAAAPAPPRAPIAAPERRPNGAADPEKVPLAAEPVSSSRAVARLEDRPSESGSAWVADPAVGAPDEAESAEVLSVYFETMESFVHHQQRIMETYLGAAEAAEANGAAHGAGWTTLDPASWSDADAMNGGAPHPRIVFEDLPGEPDARAASVSAGRFPMLAGTTEIIGGERLSARVTVDLADSIYLEDHTIGRSVSVEDSDLTGLPVVPLTFSMELMAEAAAALVPDKIVVGMREVRAHRWIGLDDGAIDLEVTAEKTEEGSTDAVRVVIREAPDRTDESDPPRPRPPFAEGTIVLAERRPASPPAIEKPDQGARPSRWRPEDVYREIMFHGPRLRAIASVDLWAEDGSEGTFVGMPHDRLFRWTDAPEFETDAITLDAAGQLVGMWTADHLASAFHVFPFRMESLEMFGPNLAPGETALCRARIVLTGQAEVRSDIDIVDSGGFVRSRISGWWDKRFDLPEQFFRLRLDPADVHLSRPVRDALVPLAHGDALSCVMLDDLSLEFLDSSGEIWLRVLAHLVLGRAEHDRWRQMTGAVGRRAEWLLGRAAVKDAVRDLRRRNGGAAMCAADIEIVAEDSGRPVVSDRWRPEWGTAPHVSIAHKSGRAVALAGAGDRFRGVGIDIERIEPRDDAFLEMAFTERERAIVAAGDARGPEIAARLWSAKEAVGKAFGRGLPDILSGVEAQEFSVEDGRTSVLPPALWSEELGRESVAPIEVRTTRHDDFVMAVAAVE